MSIVKSIILSPSREEVTTMELFGGNYCNYKFRVLGSTNGLPVDFSQSSPFQDSQQRIVNYNITPSTDEYYYFQTDGDNVLRLNNHFNVTVEVTAEPKDPLGKYILYGVLGFAALKFIGFLLC